MNTNEFVPVNWNGQGGSIIKVIGVGGGGNNAVKNMYNLGIEGVDFIICNTDEQVLRKSPVPHKIQLGISLTKGRGTGCDPEKGKMAAEESIAEIKEVLEDNAEMVFITAGMGGGTGTGAAPVIAKQAKEMGILTVAIITLPFVDEGEEPFARAIDGLEELRKHVDSMLVIRNQKLYEIYPELSVFEAFPKADDIVATAAKGIAELITKEGYINVDFADVKMVMKDSGMALMGTGRASGENRALKAAEIALNSPLLSDSNISGAKNILVNISSGTSSPLLMSELGQIMTYINKESGGNANFKRGVTKDQSLEEDVAVTIVATGFPMSTLPELEERIFNDPVIDLQDESIVISNIGSSIIEFIEETSDISNTYIDLESNIVDNAIVENNKDEDLKIIEIQTNTKSTEKIEFEQRSIVFNINTLHNLKEKDILNLENTPAFERQKKNISQEVKVSNEELLKHSISEKNGQYSINNNPFLIPDVD